MEDGQPQIYLSEWLRWPKKKCTYNFGDNFFVIISLKLYKQTVTDSYCLETYTLLFIVDVLLKPAGDAPIMKKKKWAVDRNKRIGWVGEFIKKYLKLTAQDSVVCYITNTI